MLHATSRSIGENPAESRASRPLQVAEAIKEETAEPEVEDSI